MRPRWHLLAFDLLAPVLLSVAAVHELLYNEAGAGTWALVAVLVWPLVVRRRAPVPVLAWCLLVAVVLWTMQTTSVSDLSVLVALYTVAARHPVRHALLATVAVEIGAVLVAFRIAPSGSVNDAVILFSGLVAAALLLGTTVRAQRRYLASVEDRAERLEFERAQQAELAAAAERTRIAREMHDIVAHGLSVVIALSQGAAITARQDPEAAARAMEQAAAAGRSSLDEMRTLLSVLRTDGPPATAPQPGLELVGPLLDDVRRTGLAVDSVCMGDTGTVPATVQAALYRIVQEALTNVLKHADRATRVSVCLDIDPAGVRFAITDDGRDADGRWSTGGQGNGVLGMTERVSLFGGTLECGPTGAGWRVLGRVPIAPR